MSGVIGINTNHSDSPNTEYQDSHSFDPNNVLHDSERAYNI